eukprot:TRINITY_DN6583_c0_g2_i1.p1 TRINITY_DN6583_c0_g2~~TRINITY_DN6583_c0_g2_i1.p1  ORF type:complete len:287 (+),score=59.37 TRINITY_DN6583_c0_g2_i1:56-916(+)
MASSPRPPSAKIGQYRMQENQDAPQQGAIANPFESTFHLLRALRDEIQDLKTEICELRAAKVARFEKLEEKVEDLRGATSSRFQSVEATAEKLRSDMNAGFEHTSTLVEDLRATARLRLDRLEAALKDEVSDRFTAVQVLDKKIRVETAQLRAKSEATCIELNGHKQKAEADLNADRQNHFLLRQDVERIAALLAENSMARDPFKDLGYSAPGNSASPTTSPVCTSRGGGGAALASLAHSGKFILPKMSPMSPVTQADSWRQNAELNNPPVEMGIKYAKHRPTSAK